MKLDIAAIKARKDKASGAFITCVAGDGKPYVKFQFRELKAAQDFHGAVINGRTDIPDLIAALEASETARVKAEQELRRAKNTMRIDKLVIGYLKQKREEYRNGASKKRKAAADRITALEAERDAETAAFKNFHRMLCERFDCHVHDEIDWKRDQVSLMEWIAKRIGKAEGASEWLADLMLRYPLGTQLVSPIDDLDGEVVGYYRTREGKFGLALQQNGKRIVHVYQTKWFDEDARRALETKP